MKLNALNQTVILIDTEYLNSKIKQVLECYQEVYSVKVFKMISLGSLLYNFVVNARIEESGSIVDVLFAYRLSESKLTFCQPSHLLEFIDVHNISMETDRGILRIRSFFADEDESCIQHFINMLGMVYRDKNVSRIIMVADNAELNDDLEIMNTRANKSLFMIKDATISQIEVPITYVNIDYPIGFSLGLKQGEL